MTSWPVEDASDRRERRDRMWGVFVEQLNLHMRTGVTAAALAAKLGTDPDRVRNWMYAKSRPDLHELPLINQALDMGGDRPGLHDPTYLLRRMGLLQDSGAHEDYALAYRIQKLDLRFRESIERNAQMGRESGVATILRAARESREWAAAVWPAFEGPEHCRMHVADRIDLRRIDGSHTGDAFADPIMHAALREAYAVPSRRGPRWTAPDVTDDVTSDAVTIDPTLSRWSILHVGAPMSPVRRVPHPGAPSMLCYSLTSRAWTNDVGNLVAFALGYGLSTTRDLAMEVTGVTMARTATESRSAAHVGFLASPPLRRVWTHHAPPDEVCPDPFAGSQGDVSMVWLREDDTLLESFSRSSGAPSVDVLRSARDRVDELVQRHEDRVLVVQTQWIAEEAGKWGQALETAAQVFEHSRDAGRLDDSLASSWETTRRMSPHSGRPFLDWLEHRLSGSSTR